MQTRTATARRYILHLLKPKSLFLRLAKPSAFLFLFQSCCTGMKIELSVLSVYSVLSVSFYLDPCYIGMEIERTTVTVVTTSYGFNPCYIGMEIERRFEGKLFDLSES